MALLRLNEASRDMSKAVSSVAAIPLVSPNFLNSADSVVTGVLYIDSDVPDFVNDPNRMRTVISMAESFMRTMKNEVGSTEAGNITANAFWDDGVSPHPQRLSEPIDMTSTASLEVCDALEPPLVAGTPYINFDYSDFQVVER